ncbi:MAG: arsenate reductase ArsC [Solidesulfovibrio sp.]|uniref:arsenate reductase ArsC n=1 Tax=Solidesulfovibrio sp. TaxID=2910990 RepID=UPI002B2061B3|nr:arsenate reductase ArsC [Solidesulfovibrio sp.]MEA4858304.1 arsenate reductase ArsC [Solidesulfovibrio sp.]
MSRKPRILFLCTGNACRSQMAEGFARADRGDVVEAFSAGVEKHGLDQRAVAVMAEAGVDIAGQVSKLVDELPDVPFDYVVTLCGSAHDRCPFFPGPVRKVHVPFEDPPALAATAVTEAEALGHYRAVRDAIRAFVAGLPQRLEPGD